MKEKDRRIRECFDVETKVFDDFAKTLIQIFLTDSDNNTASVSDLPPGAWDEDLTLFLRPEKTGKESMKDRFTAIPRKKSSKLDFHF